MFTKLNSRKLWVFGILAILVVCNYAFDFGLPSEDLLYLIILGGSYILGQGFVDAKQQTVQDFPVDLVTDLISAELQKLGQGTNVPMEKIIELLIPILKQTLNAQEATTSQK
jgi:uncharacterized protein (DUF2062 family)